MKKLVPNTRVNSGEIDMFAGWTFYIGLLAIIVFWSLGIDNAIWLTAGISAIAIAILGIISSQIKKNLISHLCDFDSEKASALNGQYLYSSDAFPAYWDEDGHVYLVLHTIHNSDEIYVFTVPAKWYESILDLPTYFTHFEFKDGFEKHHKLHLVGLLALPINHYVLERIQQTRKKQNLKMV